MPALLQGDLMQMPYLSEGNWASWVDSLVRESLRTGPGSKGPPSAPPTIPPIIINPFSYQAPAPAIDPRIPPLGPPVRPAHRPPARCDAAFIQ